ncbi:DUF6314 family protein [Salinarimonas rosea]|uniref:DUF6314 family protein n=1 Tax=Salinarimonas rosea TaxID=552063 RepID=UPI00041B5EB1|nr:DUF6314 family protein [Salinarimonas rosea]
MGWGSPDAVLAVLEGAWEIDRLVEGLATLRGAARFTPMRDGALAYHESGTLALADGRCLRAARRYVFRAVGGGFDVLFDEAPQRRFHRILPVPEGDALVGTAAHLCGADTYESTYRFEPDGTMRIVHRVRGPAKDYVSRTLYRRRGA